MGSFTAVFSSSFPLLSGPLTFFTACDLQSSAIFEHKGQCSLIYISFFLKRNKNKPWIETDSVLDGLGILCHVFMTETYTSALTLMSAKNKAWILNLILVFVTQYDCYHPLLNKSANHAVGWTPLNSSHKNYILWSWSNCLGCLSLCGY